MSGANYDAWTQPELVVEVKARVKAGAISPSDLDYQHPDNMSMDDVRSTLYLDDFALTPCACPICQANEALAHGCPGAEIVQEMLSYLERESHHNEHTRRHYLSFRASCTNAVREQREGEA